MATTSAVTRQLSDGNSQGTVLGRNTSDLIGFYGVDPGVSQQTATSTAVALAALGSQTASGGGFGASSAAIMTSTFALVNALRDDVSAMYSALKALNIVG
jgi:uncharacterized protein YgiB involved in biofilm formation